MFWGYVSPCNTAYLFSTDRITSSDSTVVFLSVELQCVLIDLHSSFLRPCYLRDVSIAIGVTSFGKCHSNISISFVR